MRTIKLFDTQASMDEYIAKSVVDSPKLFLYSEREFGNIICDIKQPAPFEPATLLYGTKREYRYPYQIDLEDYYEYDGEIEINGQHYYKWIKHENGGDDRDFDGRLWLLTETRDFSNVSFANPYVPVGCILDDSEGQNYYIPLIYYGGTQEPTEIYGHIPYHDTSTMDKNGHEYVDLGLPSGALWAKYNVGAQSEEEYGDYFQFGATTGYTGDDAKAHSYWSTCPFNNGSSDYDESYFKANISNWFDRKIRTDILKPEYDGVKANMGGDWHMPTADLIAELVNNSSWEWIEDYNGSGKNGTLFTGPNGNTLFIPVSGYYNFGYLHYEGSGGYVWSSTLYGSYPFSAYYLNFYSDSCNLDGYIRCGAFAVRGVIW